MSVFDSIRIAKPAVAGGYYVKDRKRRVGASHKGAPAAKEVCEYLDAYKAECRGALPTVEQIRVHMGWSARSASRYSLRKMAANSSCADHKEEILVILKRDNRNHARTS